MLRQSHMITSAATTAGKTRRLPSPCFAASMLVAAMLIASPAITEADCPGIPPLCGMTCSLDPFGTPIYCSNGQCSCAPGYDTKSAPGGGLVCQPIAPEVIGTEGRDSGDLEDMKYSCSGICTSDQDNQVGGAVPWSPVGTACQGGSQSGTQCFSASDCTGTCGPKTTGQCQGGINDGHVCHDASQCPGTGAQCVATGFCSGAGGLCTSDADCSGQCVAVTYKPFDIVPVHGIAPGGEAFMPVWGNQTAQCGDHGVGGQCSGGSNNGSSCDSTSDCPGGTCALVGTCDGGSKDSGICYSGADCTGTCGPKTTGQCQGGINDGLTCHEASQCPGTGAQCVPMGFCSGVGGLCTSDADCGGTCQTLGRCTTDGRTCGDDTQCPGGTCAPVRSWGGCAPDPFPFCFGLQDSDEGDFDFPNCNSTEGCGGCSDVDCGDWGAPRSAPPGTTDACGVCGTCVADHTSAWPYIDNSAICAAGTIPNPFHEVGGVTDPARIDFPNNVIVYRAPTRWEEFSDNAIDHDYTWDTNSPGHELHDTDNTFTYHPGCVDENHGRVHTEFDRFESVNHFTNHDWGPANAWWRELRCVADKDFCTLGISGQNQTDASRTNDTRCFVKSSVNPLLTCPAGEDVDGDCDLHDPMAVTVGVPSLDCADDAYQGTDEIHPVLGMAIRIHEDPTTGPEQWAFFYRQNGGTGPCGGTNYSRCLSTFQLPLGLPVVVGNGILTGADVQVDWHGWAITEDLDDAPTPTDVAVDKTFDLTNGTVLNITLPHWNEGVVGLVTVTPTFDTTPPQITCPGNVSQPVDLGKCTAAVSFPPPTVSDNCSVTASCSPESGSTFPIGTTTDTCTATDQAGLPASCSFDVTVTAGNKCPHDHGYWKHHANLWPVDSLTLGTVTYSKTQLLSILNNPTTGDASVILAKAEIATLLSLANGSNPAPICATVADADDALDGSIVPAKVGPKTVSGQRMVGDSNTLSSYNSGNLTPVCAP